MKGLFEKKYNDALGWMRKVYPTLTGADKEDAEHFFPELKESEDERIRNDIMEAVENWLPYERVEEIRAYLERQKEQQPEECIPDSVKFEEGFKTGRELGFREGFESVKPEEWSEEDDIMLNDIIRCLPARSSTEFNLKRINWPFRNFFTESSRRGDLEKLGEIAQHLIAVKDHEEDMRLTDDEWLLLERIGYPERFNARKEE